MTTETKNRWWPLWFMLLPFGVIIAGFVVYRHNPKGSIVRYTYWWILAVIFGLGLIGSFAQ